MPDFDQWRKDLERWGVVRFLHIRAMTFLRRWLTLCRVHVRKLDAAAPMPELKAPFTARIATKDDLLEAARDPAMGMQASAIEAALERGDMCGAVFDGDRMVAYTWRSFTTAPHADGLWVTFARPYRYGYKALTRPEYRGMHLQDAAVVVTEAACIERGYTHGVSFVESHNYPSITQDNRRGNRLVGWAGYVKLFGRVYPFRTPGAKRHTFRFVRM